MNIPTLFGELKTKWDLMIKSSIDWLNHLTIRLGASTDPDSQKVQSLISSQQPLIIHFDTVLKGPTPVTTEELCATADTANDFLIKTKDITQELVQSSQSDSTDRSHADTVMVHRNEVQDQIEEIYRQARKAKPLKRGTSHSKMGASVPVVVSSAPPNLFLTTMTCLFQQQSSSLSYGITQQFIDITQLFFDNESFSSNTIYDPPLSDSDIEGLTASWNAVIAVFADPSHAPPQCIDFKPDNFVQEEAELFKIHDQIDTLYDHLETDIVRKSTSILLPNLP